MNRDRGQMGTEEMRNGERPDEKSNEWFNAASHFVAFLMSVAALVLLVVPSARLGKTLHVVTFSIYGSTLCLLYFASASYHFISRKGPSRAAEIFQRIDHCAIYLLIAGTYTPMSLLVLKGGWGWSLFGVSWGLSLFGIIMKVFIKDPDHVLPYSLYGIMGWLALVAVVPIVRIMHPVEIALLLGGGILYTVGAILLGYKRPRLLPGIFGYHELWHIFVMGGSALHYILMLKAVLNKY